MTTQKTVDTMTASKDDVVRYLLANQDHVIANNRESAYIFDDGWDDDTDEDMSQTVSDLYDDAISKRFPHGNIATCGEIAFHVMTKRGMVTKRPTASLAMDAVIDEIEDGCEREAVDMAYEEDMIGVLTVGDVLDLLRVGVFIDEYQYLAINLSDFNKRITKKPSAQ